jgi:hypothetical protein
MMNAKDDGQENSDDGFDLALARAVRDLEPELEPTRHLWPGIERKISDYPQRRQFSLRNQWLAMGMAASFVMAASALTLALVNLNGPATPWVAASSTPLDIMSKDHNQVRSPLLVTFAETNKQLDPETLNSLFLNLEILAQARRDIEAQLRINPQDGRLLEQLMQIHEQELELLKQDYLAQSRSM